MFASKREVVVRKFGSLPVAPRLAAGSCADSAPPPDIFCSFLEQAQPKEKTKRALGYSSTRKGLGGLRRCPRARNTVEGSARALSKLLQPCRRCLLKTHQATGKATMRRRECERRKPVSSTVCRPSWPGNSNHPESRPPAFSRALCVGLRERKQQIQAATIPLRCTEKVNRMMQEACQSVPLRQSYVSVCSAMLP